MVSGQSPIALRETLLTIAYCSVYYSFLVFFAAFVVFVVFAGSLAALRERFGLTVSLISSITAVITAEADCATWAAPLSKKSGSRTSGLSHLFQR